ncbi:MAG: prepilin-type N-terminal cleavage/methylation domain-containing protein, partial [Candidatus Marinimicrobia bacterium]|nr:prepilin-type N-terminal cleavage/methylation domain-containing protein [Candidatus Neomarinimicrobiota bacterium]
MIKKTIHNNRYVIPGHQSGMTLIEIIIVIIIIGIIAGISTRSVRRINENARFNETIAEMNVLAEAIVGNPNVIQNNIRIDFGYVGDTGVMPPTIDDLFSNVSTVAGWDGPYVDLGYSADPGYFKRDAWGNSYTYVLPGDPAGTPRILTPADGDTITRDIAGSVNAVINNRVRIRPYDVDGNMINGSNGVVDIHYSDTWNSLPYNSSEGYFENSTIPIGLHQVRVISAADTAYKAFSIVPATSMGSPQQMTVYPLYGEVTYAAASYTLGGAGLNELSFIVNNSGGPTFNIDRVNIELTPLSNDCMNCEDPYLNQFSANMVSYWLWNSGHSALAANGAWIILDNDLKIYSGLKSLGPFIFEDASDGTGNSIDLQSVKVDVQFHPTSGPRQSITFNTSGSCVPTSISLNGTPSNVGTSVDFNVRNSGTLAVQINSLSIETTFGANTYLGAIEIPSSTNVWDETTCGSGNRPQING